MWRMIALAIDLLWVPPAGAAAPVFVCQTLRGEITVTRFFDGGPTAQETRRRLAQHSTRCWESTEAMLPPYYRPDPRSPGGRLSQRHRWRAAGSSVVIDGTIQRPHPLEAFREIRATLPPERLAALSAVPAGASFLRAIQVGEWGLARFLLGTHLGRILTAAEVSEIRAIARDYEADLD